MFQINKRIMLGVDSTANHMNYMYIWNGNPFASNEQIDFDNTEAAACWSMSAVPFVNLIL